jgi:ubiquinone/menaquinone biosynthesis C-methylase UbiE
MDGLAQKTIETYNRIAKDYSDTRTPLFYLKEIKDFQKLVNGKKIIDIGCGSGRDAVLFEKEGFQYTGVDASSEMIEEARKKTAKANFVVMDFYNLDFPPKSFDGFWAAASIMHVTKFRIRKLLKSMERLLKPKGIGFISIKERGSLDDGIIREERFGGIERYFAFYKINDFAKILRDLGFSILKSYRRKEGKTNWLCYFVMKG